MLMEISSRLSRLETREQSSSRGPEGRFHRQSSSRESGAHKHCWYLRPDASLAIVVDSSDTAVGAALHQQTSEGWQPLAFFSKTLSPVQRRYSAYDRELLAAYMAIKYFRPMVEGRVFTLFTDHKPLVYAFKQEKGRN
ncbi:retrovirus-related Pol polyprotein from transposon 297 [Trichonephila inaurata madagascariensis]|uniref:Retrovirus-related Pol polyprotein from transposon 297 n=1 Tax=Trichonephila inaurata madagascariensis TaxID=2747483 RepID=A0A8X6YHM8_9ARAC|nr:retrovirus-related Pol polyprotein from transposon 297 [Trichonephila inaurata madagascariensis]